MLFRSVGPRRESRAFGNLADIRGRPVIDRGLVLAMGSAGTLAHYFGMIADFADSVEVATPIMDCVVPLYRRCMEMGLGDKDVAAMVDVIAALPRAKHS